MDELTGRIQYSRERRGGAKGRYIDKECEVCLYVWGWRILTSQSKTIVDLTPGLNVVAGPKLHTTARERERETQKDT